MARPRLGDRGRGVSDGAFLRMSSVADAESTGDPGTESTGDPGTESTGDPGTESTGDPGTENTGDPGADPGVLVDAARRFALGGVEGRPPGESTSRGLRARNRAPKSALDPNDNSISSGGGRRDDAREGNADRFGREMTEGDGE